MGWELEWVGVERKMKMDAKKEKKWWRWDEKMDGRMSEGRVGEKEEKSVCSKKMGEWNGGMEWKNGEGFNEKVNFEK